MGVAAPDHSTISRFRLELTRLGVMDKLLKELNKQFKKQGISRIDHGAIVDASIVDSPHAPDGSIPIKRPSHNISASAPRSFQLDIQSI